MNSGPYGPIFKNKQAMCYEINTDVIHNNNGILLGLNNFMVE